MPSKTTFRTSEQDCPDSSETRKSIRTFKPYPEYKDSGVEWLGKVPVGWEVVKLKHCADVMPSNVDKKSVEGQFPVKLCNYTDVYYNDSITSTIPFMKASAATEQIRKFQLRRDDVLLTKDSEDPNDIAVPAYVPKALPGVLCGYHLAVLRPRNANGAFLKRFIESRFASCYFATRANGLTRYGLGTYQLVNAPVSLPPLPEQKRIVAFLDHETARMDALISRQERLIELLKEKRRAVITHAVTKGLNPDVPMKDSGVEWLGEVPKHWVVSRVGLYAESLDFLRVPIEASERGSRKGDFPYYGASGIIDHVDGYLFDEPLVLVCEDGWNLVLRSKPVARQVSGKIWVNNHAHILRSRAILPEFLAEVIEQTALTLFVTGMRQPKLTTDMLRQIPIIFPRKVEEQETIVAHFHAQTARIDRAVEAAQRAVALLEERRTALISAAVTGKIDVRDWEAPVRYPESNNPDELQLAAEAGEAYRHG